MCSIYYTRKPLWSISKIYKARLKYKVKIDTMELKDSLSTTMQCGGHTLNFVWYEIRNLVNCFPREIVILVNLCNPILFSGFVCSGYGSPLWLYRRSSKLLVILLKDQLFHEKIVLSDCNISPLGHRYKWHSAILVEYVWEW